MPQIPSPHTSLGVWLQQFSLLLLQFLFSSGFSSSAYCDASTSPTLRKLNKNAFLTSLLPCSTCRISLLPFTVKLLERFLSWFSPISLFQFNLEPQADFHQHCFSRIVVTVATNNIPIAQSPSNQSGTVDEGEHSFLPETLFSRGVWETTLTRFSSCLYSFSVSFADFLTPLIYRP